MSWKYGLKDVSTENETILELTEVYDKTSWVSDSIAIYGETPEEVIEILKQAVSDLENDLLIMKESS